MSRGIIRKPWFDYEDFPKAEKIVVDHTQLSNAIKCVEIACQNVLLSFILSLIAYRERP